MAEKRSKGSAARKTAVKRAPKGTAAASPRAAPPVAPPPGPAVPACPRCGTSKFGPEDRIRAEGNRTVRYTILVCERGHTFARPVTRGPR